MISIRKLACLTLQWLRNDTNHPKTRAAVSSVLKASCSRRQFAYVPCLTIFALAQDPSPSYCFSSSAATTHTDGGFSSAITSLQAKSEKKGDNMIFDTGYLDAKSAAALDEELMVTPGFTLEQLMELAGLSVAEAVYTVLREENEGSAPSTSSPRILLVCGPGNNGGDGLVAARHLKLFGYECTIVYPKRSSRQPHYGNLVQQCQDLSIEILHEMPENYEEYRVIVDAIFGFSFQGEPREPFATILKQIQQSQDEGKSIVVAVDVPSGWHVDDGDVLKTGYLPEVLVSLTAPKLSAKGYPKRHFVGGRFLPPALAGKYNVRMPPYPGVAQVMEVNRGGSYSWEMEYGDYLAEKEAKEFSSYAAADEGKQQPQQQAGWEEEYASYSAGKEMMSSEPSKPSHEQSK